MQGMSGGLGALTLGAAAYILGNKAAQTWPVEIMLHDLPCLVMS